MENTNPKFKAENEKQKTCKIKKKTELLIAVWIARCIVRFAISKEILMDVLDAFEVSCVCTVKYKAKATTVRGAVRKGENRGKLLCRPLTRNANFEKILMDVLHRLHPRRVFIVNYKGKFRKRANGRRVRKAPGLKYAACAQK